MVEKSNQFVKTGKSGTIFSHLFGQAAAEKWWSRLKKCTPVGFSIWLVALVLCIPVALSPESIDSTHLGSTCLFTIAGLWNSTLILFLDRYIVLRLLTRTFESMYLTFLNCMLIYGLYSMHAQVTVPIAFLIFSSLLFVLLLDAAPGKMRNSRANKLGVLIGAVVLTGLGIAFFLLEDNNRLIQDRIIELPNQNKMSLWRRLVIKPMLTLAFFFAKNFTSKIRNPEKMLMLSCAVDERTFATVDDYKAYLKDRDAKIETWCKWQLEDQKRRPLSTANNRAMNAFVASILQASAKPQIIKNGQQVSSNSVAARVFGKRASKIIHSTLRSTTLSLSIAFQASVFVFLAAMIGLIPKRYALIGLPGCAAPWLTLTTANWEMCKMLARSFQVIFFTTTSLLLVVGLVFALPDERGLLACFLFTPAVTLGSFLDALGKKFRAKLPFFYAQILVVLATISWAFLTRSVHEPNRLQIATPVKPVTTDEVLIYGPLTVVIPFFAVFFIRACHILVYPENNETGRTLIGIQCKLQIKTYANLVLALIDIRTTRLKTQGGEKALPMGRLRLSDIKKNQIAPAALSSNRSLMIT